MSVKNSNMDRFKRVRIMRVNKDLPMPEYQTEGSVAFDFYARGGVNIQPGKVERIDTNLVIKVPEGFMLLIKDRSSTAKKVGVLITAGVVDQDYCGPNDEIKLQFYNPTNKVIRIKHLQRIAQGIFLPIYKPNFVEVKNMESKDRGGFGSTGEMA